MSSAPQDTRKIDGHAIVMGGSIGGLLAASVLSEFYEQVTVLEKRPQPGNGPDPPLPQSSHVHSFLSEGQRQLDVLIPGMSLELERLGARVVDFGHDFRFFHHGILRPQYQSEITVLFQTRPFLEDQIRHQVMKLPNVTMLWDTCAQGFHCNSKMSHSIAGVKVRNAFSGTEQTMAADLVVDASGRASKTPLWLKELDLECPESLTVKLDLCYASRLYEEPRSHSAAWKGLIVYPRAPGQTCAGYIFPVQDGRWLVSLAGYGGDRPASDDHGFREFARSLPSTEIYEAISAATPLSEIRSIKFESQRWLRYDRLRLAPDRLIVMGDAFCSLNPIFGQGMALCAMQAAALRNCMADTNRKTMKDISARCQRRLGTLVRTPWLLTTSEAFRYPSTRGDRLSLSPLMRWYAHHVFELSGDHVDIYDAFLRVMHMLSPLSALFTPGIVFRVLQKSLKERIRPGSP